MSLNNVKKKDRARELMKKNQSLFKCPLCSDPMFMSDFNTLTCNSKHSFDLSKKGYINLLTSNHAVIYSKTLFEARHRVCAAGFYDPLIDKLTEIIYKFQNSVEKSKINILDAGCGEGSHIYDIFNRSNRDSNMTFVGVDISKDSINIATRNDGDIIWCVADLARLPFHDSSFDLVLNILSPANYSEFERILDSEGMVIKVVPNAQYLTELRETIYGEEESIHYSNDKVVHHFQEKLDIVDIQNINYQFSIDKELLSDFITMTPLTWGKSTERLRAVYEKNIASITADLVLIIGKKKR